MDLTELVAERLAKAGQRRGELPSAGQLIYSPASRSWWSITAVYHNGVDVRPDYGEWTCFVEKESLRFNKRSGNWEVV
jgi:hypothetical protein